MENNNKKHILDATDCNTAEELLNAINKDMKKPSLWKRIKMWFKKLF